VNHSMPGPFQVRTDRTDIFRPGTGRITGGIWDERRRINRAICVPDGWERLHDASNYHNLELAAGRTTGEYVNDLPFLDSDVYKWLEACAWVLADPDTTEDLKKQLRTWVGETTEILEAAQEPDGYLNSNFQVRTPGERWAHLNWGHELYCAGHLIQAAVAMRRTAGDERLFALATRMADLVCRTFGKGEGQREGIPGHPEIETALVELYRETGEAQYLATASYFVDSRGHRTLPVTHRFGSVYWQDHAPVREAKNVEGHAVRQLYLLAGVADVATEVADEGLEEACERLWHKMVTEKTYITGGVGAHYADEAFGDPYELPSERSYCETCAAIASIMFSQRMLILRGEAKYGDLIERTLYNGFLAGLSLDGRDYIYANPLQVREGHVDRGVDDDYRRVPWFHCACCPPNVMRLLASIEHYVVLARLGEVALSQYITGAYQAGAVRLSVETDYPWNGRVRVVVTESPAEAWVMRLRVPGWADDAEVTVNGEVRGDVDTGWWVIEGIWSQGDIIEINLPMQPRFSRADPRVDSLRACVALERGPLVYCLEAADNSGIRFDDIVVDPAVGVSEQPGSNVLAGVTALTFLGQVRSHDTEPAWPYRDRAESARGSSNLTAIPYFSWGNREPGAMRVWLPTL